MGVNVEDSRPHRHLLAPPDLPLHQDLACAPSLAFNTTTTITPMGPSIGIAKPPSAVRDEGSRPDLDPQTMLLDEPARSVKYLPYESKIALMMTAAVLAITYAIFLLYKLFTPDGNAVEIVNTTSKVAALVEKLNDLPRTAGKPDIYCDIEGVDLSRHGTVSILSLYILPADTVYLIDIHKLKHKAFTTTAAGDVTLKHILEDSKLTKVFFDVRNDSDALYSHFHVNLAGIQDLQLMELAARWGGTEARKYVKGLAKAIIRDSSLSPDEKARSSRIKESGNKLFAPDRGGSLQVFNQRPLKKEIVDYCAVDVKVLPSLWDVYNKTLQLPVKKDWRKRVAKATLERIQESQSKDYKSIGQHKVLGPWYFHYPESEQTNGQTNA